MLKSGVAERDITPPVGNIIACFPVKGSPRRAEGAHDRLVSKALAILGDDGRFLVICATDTCMMRRESIERMTDSICGKYPAVDPDRILFTSTHTHSGPDTSWLFGCSPDDPAILRIESMIAESVLEALDNVEDATLCAGCMEFPLTHNRRIKNAKGATVMQFIHEDGVTDGPVDHEMVLLHFRKKSDKSTIAVLYNYAAHALTVGPHNRLYTADFPGEVRRLLEPVVGGDIIFLNGAAGDIHPRTSMQQDFSGLEKMGREFADSVMTLLRRTTPVEVGDINISREKMDFPNRVDDTLTVLVDIAVLSLGGIVVGFVPGEFFNEFQSYFKEQVRITSENSMVMMVGYCGDWVGYVPTESSYKDGGYGVDLWTGDPAEYSRTALPKGAGEKITARLVELANQIKTRAAP